MGSLVWQVQPALEVYRRDTFLVPTADRQRVCRSVRRDIQRHGSSAEARALRVRAAFARPVEDISSGGGGEGERATLLAHSLICIHFMHLKRSGRLLLGWSSGSCFFSEDCARGRAEVALLRRAVENYEYIESARGIVAGIDAFVSVAVASSTWRPFNLTQGAREWFCQPQARLLGSHLIEDGFNEQKTARPYRNRASCMQTSYHTLIQRQGISAKHDFQDVGLASAPPPSPPCQGHEAQPVVVQCAVP